MLKPASWGRIVLEVLKHPIQSGLAHFVATVVGIAGKIVTRNPAFSYAATWTGMDGYDNMKGFVQALRYPKGPSVG